MAGALTEEQINDLFSQLGELQQFHLEMMVELENRLIRWYGLLLCPFDTSGSPAPEVDSKYGFLHLVTCKILCVDEYSHSVYLLLTISSFFCTLSELGDQTP